jgi:hypothetical protein
MLTIVFLLLLVAAIALAAWWVWPKIAPHVADSETILAARAMSVVGAFVGVLVLVTPDQVGTLLTAMGLGPYTPVVLVILGIVTELARRNRATDLK